MTSGHGDVWSEGLGAAVAATGGIRAVARRTGLDPSNVSRWLRTSRGLAPAAIGRVFAALGRPGGVTAKDRVVALSHHDPDIVRAALHWYMPAGCEVVRGEWTNIALRRAAAVLGPAIPPTIHAGRSSADSRIVVIMPPGLSPGTSDLIRWWRGDSAIAVLNWQAPEAWIRGTVSVAEFDESWPGHDSYDPGQDELITEIRRLGLSYKEAIRRIQG